MPDHRHLAVEELGWSCVPGGDLVTRPGVVDAELQNRTAPGFSTPSAITVVVPLSESIRTCPRSHDGASKGTPTSPEL